MQQKAKSNFCNTMYNYCFYCNAVHLDSQFLNCISYCLYCIFVSLNIALFSKSVLQCSKKVNGCSIELGEVLPSNNYNQMQSWGQEGSFPYIRGFIKNNRRGRGGIILHHSFLQLFFLWQCMYPWQVLTFLLHFFSSFLPCCLLFYSLLCLYLHSLPLFPLIVLFLIADIKMAKCCPLMGRDIPGVSQMSVLLCSNLTLVESIFLGKRGSSQSMGHRDTCSSGVVVTTDQCWTWLNTDPNTELRAHTHTHTPWHLHSHRKSTPTVAYTSTHVQYIPLCNFPHLYNCLSSSFIDVQADESNTVKMRTAASINSVINLSQSLKLAVIGLILVNHACQWCRKE